MSQSDALSKRPSQRGIVDETEAYRYPSVFGTARSLPYLEMTQSTSNRKQDLPDRPLQLLQRI